MTQPTNPNPTSARAERISDALDIQPRKYATAILSAVETSIPRINESAFKARVIPLLQRIMVPANRAAYQKIVIDLMMPLNVVSDQDRDLVLHTVPPIARTPRTTIPQADGGLTAADVIYNMNRYRDLQRNDLMDDTMRGFLRQITILPDLIDDILLPIDRILRSYGTSLDVTATAANPMGTQLLPISSAIGEEVGFNPPSDSFSDEEDDY